ncbi:MAG TPA: hypothetical protein VGQ44_13750 [Gemmatimonadaceae bacterium]|nr:hypothetical protein [Gemmatimonadaceae bacterium]
MTRHSRLSIIAVAALATATAAATAAAPRNLRAQVRRLTDVPTDSVPKALVEAVIDPIGAMRMMSGGARPRLLIGTLPSGLAQRLWIPPGSTVLGGIESSGFGIAIIHSAMSEDSLNAGYAREEPRMGWTLPPARTSAAPAMGFVQAPTTLAVVNGVVEGGLFCSGGTTLSISVSPLDPLTREIRATAMNTSDMRCQTPASAPRTVIPGRPNYPTLVNPAGSGPGYVPCASWNSMGGGGTTRLQTNMSADDVLQHYGKQLADSGWTPGPDQSVSRSWSRRDSTGTLTQLTLTTRLAPSTPGCVEVQMDVRSRRP